MAVYYVWPVIPAVGLIWRWSFVRLLSAFFIWMVAAFVVLLWRSVEPEPWQILIAFAIDAIPSLMVTLVFYSRDKSKLRLHPGCSCRSSVLPRARWLGCGCSPESAGREAQWFKAFIAPLEALPSTLGLVLTFMAFGLLPVLVAWWPLRRFGRALGRAYARQRVSELLVVFTAVWAVLLLGFVATTMDTAGASATLLMAPLLWVPTVMLPCARRRRPAGARPTTLLVLRVFQRHAEVQGVVRSSHRTLAADR